MDEFPARATFTDGVYHRPPSDEDKRQTEEYVKQAALLFADALSAADGTTSAIEFKAKAGKNLMALRAVYPRIDVRGVESNLMLSGRLAREIGEQNIIRSSIFDANIDEPADLTFVRGVMIYLDPNRRPAVYEALYKASKKFILIVEDFNPAPITRHTQWQLDAIYKRDYAGEMLDQFRDLSLVDYGFRYRRDLDAPEHNALWFLMRKP